MNAKPLLTACWLIILAGCAQTTTPPPDANTSGTPDLPNPASAYCEQQGYKLEIRTASDGSQSGVCIFPDGSECDEWAYYRRECTPATQDASMPNPASVYCEQQGYTVEVRTASDGSQSGACIFPNGSECDEWAYFRGECKPSGQPTEAGSLEWAVYSDKSLGYSFRYPSNAQVTPNDDPLRSVTIAGEGMGDENWTIAHPADRPDYHPPEGTDLLPWLIDHNLLGENRQTDTQIGGLTAIHFRHEASPQSYAFDQYYFAHAGQLYQVILGHASQTEDWELNNRFLQSFQFSQPAEPSTTSLPTALPIDASTYQDWITYTNSTYGFTLRLPDGWVVDEASSSDPLLVGHEIRLENITSELPNSIRLTFRRVGEDTLLWPTGVGEGEFIGQGVLDISGQPVLRMLLVCPSGAVTAIWYHGSENQPNISLDELEFGIIFSTPGHCEPGNNLTGRVQQEGETILSTLTAP